MAFSSSLCIKPFSSNHRHRRRRCRHQMNDPSSPTVGCMGQVHRCNAVALPPPPPPMYSGYRRFNILMSSVAFFSSPMNGGRNKKSTKPGPRGRRVVAVEEIEPPPSVVVAVEGMDPPLPVVATEKKEKKIEAPTMSLWKRRCRSRKLEELFFCRQEKLPSTIAEIVV